ncbi:MAG: T9SS type A sorting domain-containing protein [Bacteroidales bacterium]
MDVAVSVYIGPAGFSEPGKVKVYYNNGGELESTPSFESYEYFTFSCALGDADGDGDLDLATTGGEPYSGLYDTGKIFYNRNGYFNSTPDWESDVSFGSLDVEFADVDQNGYLDAIFTSEETPNYIFLADEYGKISTTPSWESLDAENYINSVDFGLTGPGKIPAIVVSGNDQLGGNGEIWMYEFAYGVPATGIASWISSPVGYGSGILLSDVNLDGTLDLIYGGWWLPMKIALGETNGFELDPSYTSSTNSVVEAILVADLDRDGIETISETIEVQNDSLSVIYLEKQIIEHINSITLNGKTISPAFYCFVENKNWISFKDVLRTGDEIVVEYDYSDKGDIVITNWDNSKGNYIFYNTLETAVNFSGELNPDKLALEVSPNPAIDRVIVSFYLESKQLIEVIITGLQGKQILQSSKQWKDLGMGQMELNIETLEAGVYSLEFKAGRKTEYRKLVIK